jgi:RND family efflux transporter MFP subunit
MNITTKIAFLLLSVTWLIISCTNNKTDHAHNQQHERHIHYVELTAKKPGIEAFVKFEQPIIKQNTHIDIFLTNTNTGKNAAEYPVTLHFLDNQDIVKERQISQQDKNGIYYTDIVFNQPGTINFQLIYSAQDKSLIFPMGKFTVWGSKEVMEEKIHQHDQLNHEAEIRHANLIEFDKLQQWYVGLQAENPKITELQTTISCIGKILPLPEKKAKITSPYRGKLIFPPGFKLKLVGDRVAKGDILAVIQPLAFQPEQVDAFNLAMEEQKAKLLMDKAYSEYMRAKRLFEEDIIPQKHLISAETEYEIAKRNYENIKTLKGSYFEEKSTDSSQSSQLEYYYVKAPIDGILSCTHIFRGEFVEPHEELCQIIDPRKVWLELQVHEKDILKLSQRKAASLFITSGNTRWQIASDNLNLVSIGIALNEQTRTLPVIYELNNSSFHLKIGMMVDAALGIPNEVRGMVIPEKALIEIEGVPYVFVKVGEEKFMRKLVEIVKHGAGIVQVIKGIELDDKIVVRGVYNLKLASLKAVIPSAHEGHQH